MFKINQKNIFNFTLNKISKSNSLFSSYYRNFSIVQPVFRKEFKSHRTGESNRSQRGIWQGKQHGSGCTKSFSMVHTLRKFKVNTRTIALYSHILDKTFWLDCSSTAIRTINKYGGLDKYLLNSTNNLIKDSQFARYLKEILKKKLKDKTFNVRYLPFTQKPKFQYKKREAHEVRNIPSIYIPPEAKRTDLSEMFYPEEFFETRREKEHRLEIERKLEQETDPVKRDELKKELNPEKYQRKFRDELHTLQEFRHKLIRDQLVRFKDRTNLKLHFLKSIEQSENYAKLVLNEEYKHFSEDYPEVQLILQQTDQDKFKNDKLTGKMYKEYSYNFGETYEDSTKTEESKTFEPFANKQGKMWQTPKKRQNAKRIELEALRKLKKEKKMQQIIKNSKPKQLKLKFKVTEKN